LAYGCQPASKKKNRSSQGEEENNNRRRGKPGWAPTPPPSLNVDNVLDGKPLKADLVDGFEQRVGVCSLSGDEEVVDFFRRQCSLEELAVEVFLHERGEKGFPVEGFVRKRVSGERKGGSRARAGRSPSQSSPTIHRSWQRSRHTSCSSRCNKR
jgi:hypothetical protein